jgi:hypothetical protein
MPEETTPPAKPEGDKTFTQADVDRIVAERLTREKGKYADYDELKAKAQKFDELDASSKSELEREREARQRAEQDAASAKATALRLEVAAEKGVKPRWLTGTTREELEAAADEYLQDHPPAGGTPPPPAGRPTETLRTGTAPTEPEPTKEDLRKVIDEIPR